MKLIIKNVTIADLNSPANGQIVDLLIEDGIIRKIGNQIQDNDGKIVDRRGSKAMPGWCDLRATFGEPGLEQKESLQSGLDAAAAGGFTTVCMTPETQPALHSKSEISFVLDKAKNHPVQLLPSGAITTNLDGMNLAEMYDMKQSGAVAFSNGNQSIGNAGIMLRALLYVKNFDGLLMVHPNDVNLSNKGMMNEGVTSVLLGMKSIPAIAEELMIARDLELLKYSESRLHISHISTAGAVGLIARAKKEGLPVTCDVAIANLVFDETALLEFDTNFKVSPPLRTRADIEALINGLNDGTIDAIVSDHRPQDDEHKQVEFDMASNGMNTLQTFYPLLQKIQPLLTDQVLQKVLSENPWKILGLKSPVIKEGEFASITLINPDLTWKYNSLTNRSLSKNSPLFGTTVTGKSTGIVRGSFTYGLDE